MPKVGHSLEGIPGFDQAVVAGLREDFSISTAEEFVALWRSMPMLLSKLIGEPEKAARLADLALLATASGANENSQPAGQPDRALTVP